MGGRIQNAKQWGNIFKLKCQWEEMTADCVGQVGCKTMKNQGICLSPGTMGT